MTAIILRVIIYAAIAAFIYYAAKRLWRDLGAAFRGPGEVPPRPSPKVNESRSPDVIELKRGADGVYRPPGDDRR
ncbi:MAG: hypothetical protein ACTHOR_12985 [Devosia sp.]|jgi:hypothetical protein|nr:hypothetical protein [Devosiaceae bacterium]